MTYKPDVDQGDWFVHRRTVGIPGVDADFVGVETIPSMIVSGNTSIQQALAQSGASAGSVSGTTVSGNTSVSSTTGSVVQVGMAVTGTNVPNANAVTSGDSFDTNQITIGTVTNSSGYTGGFQAGMIIFTASTTVPGLSSWTGNNTISAMVQSVSGSVITLDRKINIPSNTRVGAFPVVTSKTSTTVTMSIAASGNGTQSLTYYYVNSCSMGIQLIYVPRTINVQHVRISNTYSSATLTAHQPMPADTQDVRVMLWGPTADTDQYTPNLPLYAISRNLISHGETRDRWSNATSTSDNDNSSFFTAGQATIQPITGTGTLTSVSTTTSTTLTSASGQAVLQVASTTGITTGMTVTAPNAQGIPTSTTVQSITAGVSVTLSTNITVTIGTSVQLYFGTLTGVANDTGYTVAAQSSMYLTGTGIPQGVSTVSTAVSANTSVTVADASTFQIGMAVVSHNAITATNTITNIVGNVLTLSASVTLSAGAGLYGYVRVSSATGTGPSSTIVMNNAPTASGAVSWSAYPYIGYNPTSATSTPLYLKIPSGTLKKNQIVVGAGMGTGARVNSAIPVSGQTNVWLVSLTSVAFSGTPGLPMTHYTLSPNANSTANNVASAGLATNQGYVVSGTVVTGGNMSADTRFIGSGSFTKPALVSGTNVQATITPTVTIRPNYSLDTKYGIGGFSALPGSMTGLSSNSSLSNFALTNPNPAFSSPLTLYGGYWYYVGVWYGGTSFSGVFGYQSGLTLDGLLGRVPGIASKQYAGKYLSNNPGNWSAGSAPSTPAAVSTWNGGYQVAGASAPAVPYKSISRLTADGIALSTDQGYSQNSLAYVMLYE